MTFHKSTAKSRGKLGSRLRAERIHNRAQLIERLRKRSKLARECGEDDFWAEMADEHENK